MSLTSLLSVIAKKVLFILLVCVILVTLLALIIIPSIDLNYSAKSVVRVDGAYKLVESGPNIEPWKVPVSHVESVLPAVIYDCTTNMFYSNVVDELHKLDVKYSSMIVNDINNLINVKRIKDTTHIVIEVVAVDKQFALDLCKAVENEVGSFNHEYDELLKFNVIDESYFDGTSKSNAFNLIIICLVGIFLFGFISIIIYDFAISYINNKKVASVMLKTNIIAVIGDQNFIGDIKEIFSPNKGVQ